MNFDLNKEEKSICQELNARLKDKAALWEEALGHEDPVKVKETLLAAFQEVAATGYTDLVFSHDKKGTGAMAVREELARLCPSIYFSLEAGNGLLWALVNTYGNEDQRERMAPALVSCKTLGSVAMVEEHGNVEDNPIQTQASLSGDQVILRGRKNMVINGPMAHWTAVACTLEGALAFALLSGQGRPMPAFTRVSAAGMEPWLYYTLDLTDAAVSRQQIIGPFEDTNPLAMVRRWEDEVLVAASLGIMRRSFEKARTHAKEHHCGGKPLVAYQEVGFKLAEMLTIIHTAQLLAYRAAWMVETSDREADTLIHCAKVFCAEAAESVSSHALRILGLQGYLGDHEVDKAYCQSKWVQIGGTSIERARMKIGQSVLGAY